MNCKSPLVFIALLLLFGSVAVLPQAPASSPPGSASGDLRLPSGRLQRDEMIKADHARNLEDAESLIKLSEDLKSEIEKNTQHVLSVSSIKKTEEIEKTAKRIRSRMRRY
jgi:hypothetical protein